VVIAPEILIPSATLAVAVLIGLVHFITGAKKTTLDHKACRDFLKLEAPDLTNIVIVLNEEHSAALIKNTQSEPVGLIRVFGDKLVFQTLNSNDFLPQENTEELVIKRSGLGNPPLLFTPEDTERGIV